MLMHLVLFSLRCSLWNTKKQGCSNWAAFVRLLTPTASTTRLHGYIQKVSTLIILFLHSRWWPRNARQTRQLLACGGQQNVGGGEPQGVPNLARHAATAAVVDHRVQRRQHRLRFQRQEEIRGGLRFHPFAWRPPATRHLRTPQAEDSVGQRRLFPWSMWAMMLKLRMWDCGNCAVLKSACVKSACVVLMPIGVGFGM
jgi:hypothetical protein